MKGALVLALALTVAACMSGQTSTTTLSTPDPGVVHVHSLDVVPGDGTLYAATHTGLFTVSEDGSAQRVGERWHDLMGFTVAGPGDLIASGHPDLTDPELSQPGVKPLLGLVASTDGADWEQLSLFGEVDFHALSAAHGKVYGWDSTSGRFMVSDDRLSWDARSELQLADFAVSPDDPNVIVGAAEQGVVRSEDGGSTWQPAADQQLLMLAWDDDGLVGAAPNGALLTSDSAATTWSRRGQLGGQPEALHADSDTLYAAVAGRGVLQSGDRGGTWTVRLPGGEEEHQ